MGYIYKKALGGGSEAFRDPRNIVLSSHGTPLFSLIRLITWLFLPLQFIPLIPKPSFVIKSPNHDFFFSLLNTISICSFAYIGLYCDISMWFVI